MKKLSIMYKNLKTFLLYETKDQKEHFYICTNDIFDDAMYKIIGPYLEGKFLYKDKEYIPLISIMRACYNDEASLNKQCVKYFEDVVKNLEKMVQQIRKKESAEKRYEPAPEKKAITNQEYLQNGLLSSSVLAKATNKKHSVILNNIEKIRILYGETYFNEHFTGDFIYVNNRKYPVWFMDSFGFGLVVQKMARMEDIKDTIQVILKQFESAEKVFEPDNKKEGNKEYRSNLVMLVNSMAREFNLEHKDIWNMVNNRFGYRSSKFMSEDTVRRAEQFIEQKSFEYRMMKAFNDLAETLILISQQKAQSSFPSNLNSIKDSFMKCICNNVTQ